jgi:hypothetical protein
MSKEFEENDKAIRNARWAPSFNEGSVSDDLEKDSGIVISMIGGNCPVQSEGTIDGQPYYFRARGSHISIGIGGSVVSSPNWYYEEIYGDGPFDAGWIEEDEAREFIEKAANIYRERMEEDKKGTKREP